MVSTTRKMAGRKVLARVSPGPTLDRLIGSLSADSIQSELRDGLRLLSAELEKISPEDKAAPAKLKGEEVLDSLVQCFTRAYLAPSSGDAQMASIARGKLVSMLGIGGILSRLDVTAQPSVPTRHRSGDATMSTEEAAVALNVSRPYVVKLADAGKLGPVVRTEGNHRRLSAESVERYRAGAGEPLRATTEAAPVSEEHRD
ncbi:excisionase family DNA binding protein [Paraburkholderia sp. BL8N3]|nr:excisionase family DNA-binding protein [Paraburkholderia sp. BL8N3]TCK38520.1 excisionase family DNA binding protein [Paraburkholderia sp. BL8N3]